MCYKVVPVQRGGTVCQEAKAEQVEEKAATATEDLGLALALEVLLLWTCRYHGKI